MYRDTPQMEALWDKIKPYLDENLRLPKDVPDEIKKASDEYLRLSREMEKFALNL